MLGTDRRLTRVVRNGLACALLLLAGQAPAALTAEQAKQFFNRHGCNACHAVDESRIGPPFRAVAIRYGADDASVATWLAMKIRVGGSGSWGFVPMISYPDLSSQDAALITDWILGLSGRPAASPNTSTQRN
jgi:cytochrome c